MEQYGKIITLLKEKYERLLEYEQATYALAESNAEDAENYIMRRDELANEIDGLTARIGEACESEENGDYLLKVAMLRVQGNEVPPEMAEVYTMAGRFQTVAQRVLKLEEDARVHLEAMRDEALVKMKEQQNVPKIKRYLSDLSDQQTTSGLMNEKI